jgi:hypothetical protein
MFMGSLEKMKSQDCTTGYSAHGVVIENLPAKITGELRQKYRREKQVLSALDEHRVRKKEKSATLQEVVTVIYGESLDQEMRELALEPFIEEVLRKLAGDGGVAFERRRGIKRWYTIQKAAPKSEMTPSRSTTNEKLPNSQTGAMERTMLTV